MIIYPLLALLLILIAWVCIHRVFQFHHRTIHEVIPFLRRLGLEEIESLLDGRDEEALRQNLTAEQFAKAQLKRIHLLREKLCCADYNASILQDWAAYELERTFMTLDGDVRVNAQALLENCREFRIATLWIKLQLKLWYLQVKILPRKPVPFISRLRKIDSFDLVECYRGLTQYAAALATACGEHSRVKLADLL